MKYPRFTPSVCKDVGIRKSEFVTTTQFLFIWEEERYLYFSLILCSLYDKETGNCKFLLSLPSRFTGCSLVQLDLQGGSVKLDLQDGSVKLDLQNGSVKLDL